jgi:RNA recognition motif-containing protein
MMTRLFVGNLPFTATDASLSALFAPHGKVESVALIMDRETGRPRGFGFIEMSASDAARAIQNVNGQDFEGRALKVNEAQERQAQGGNRRGSSRRY